MLRMLTHHLISPSNPYMPSKNKVLWSDAPITIAICKGICFERKGQIFLLFFGIIGSVNHVPAISIEAYPRAKAVIKRALP